MKFDITISLDKRILLDIGNFEFQENGITFLFGESGIGKSLISRAIYGLLDNEDLDIEINNQTYDEYIKSELCQNIQKDGFFVFQEPSSHLNPLMKISDQLCEGDLDTQNDSQKITKSLWPDTDDKQLDNLLKIYPKPYRPSGGEKQRILLAMALKKMSLATESNSGVFIFDEPTGSLDNQLRDVFLDLLIEQITQFPRTILFISHDYSIINKISRYSKEFNQKVSYTELSRNEEGHNIHHFSGKLYTDWLDRVKSQRISINTSPILAIESGFELFNHRFSFSDHSGSKREQTLKIFPHDMVYLKAGSGVGKTTLAKILVGLYKARKLNLKVGDILIDDDSPRTVWKKHIWANKIGMIFQHADEALNQNSKVKDVFTGLPKKKRPGKERLLQDIKYFYSDTITSDFIYQKVRLLSGGQKQRLNIMRTFFLETDIIILDEPLNGLDFESSVKIIEILQQKQEEEKGIILISHNEEIFDRLVPDDRQYYLIAEEI
jgi:peptide/nickel transport system ATP-binding protein